ncbi:ABC transporter ATP-binding protein [Roseomonas sp. BN140053]|uniref:ABC transporter ATP-binding protein n=1 Tax=Roseomonas sp. BN140053 TaxID=3391898 RepID=UPI0039E8F55C
MTPILRTERLRRSFGSLVVTNDVDLALQPGERHVVIGPNGAGKTSLVNQLGGQLAPSSGRIFLKGQDVTGSPPERICALGLARTFQKNNLFRNLSAVENVRLAVQARHGRPWNPFAQVRDLGALRHRAEEVLASVHLTRDVHCPVHALSYGEQRQLEIAVALASDPDVLLLDEPTSGMSPAETRRMIGLIADLPRSLTLLMIEHDMEVVFSIADRITVLHYGEVLATDTPEGLRRNQRVHDVYLGRH